MSNRVIEVIRRGQRGLDGSPGITTIEDESGNRIINGSFAIWQRGTSFTTNTYTADRWLMVEIGGDVTVTRQAVPLGTGFGRSQLPFHARIQVSGQTLVTHVASIEQRVEDVRTFSDRTVTILGWARRSAGTGNMAIAARQHFGTGGSPSSDVLVTGDVVTLTADWEPFAVPLAIPSVTGKTLGSDLNSYVAIEIFASAGSNFTRAAGLGLQAVTVDLAGIHVRSGTVTSAAAAEYIAPTEHSELFRAQRYYRTGTMYGWGYVGSATTFRAGKERWSPRMRATPSISFSGATYTNASTVALDGSSSDGFNYSVVVAAGGAYAVNANYTASAEL